MKRKTLIYHPKLKKVIGINALGVAPSGATPEFYKEKGYSIPPKYGPLSAVTPGTPAGIMVMLAEYGTMSLEEILQPPIEMAKGYPIEAQAANSIERNKEEIKKWKYSKKYIFNKTRKKEEAPNEGEIFIQKDLLNTLLKLIETEKSALNKKEKIEKKQYMKHTKDFTKETLLMK